MKNFEYLKSLDNEYEIADFILNALSDKYHEMFKINGEIQGLPLLKWLQEEKK